MKKKRRLGIVKAYDYENRIGLIISGNDCFYTTFVETNTPLHEGDTVNFIEDEEKPSFARSVTALKKISSKT